MKKVLCFLVAVFMGISALTGSGIVDSPVFAEGESCSGSFLGLKPWYDGLLEPGSCNVKTPTESELPKFVWTIVLNIVYDVTLVVGIVAIGFIIFGGYLFITSEGDPGKAGKAKKTLSAAIIGLVIAVLATVIVNTITGILTSGS